MPARATGGGSGRHDLNRRAFLKLAAGACLAASVGGCAAGRRGNGPSSKRILVLGGTNFVGPAIVERALARGHEVTLFNRGITRPYLFPDVEKLRGDRARAGGDLTALEGSRTWDAMIDVWPDDSALVAATARGLRERVEYAFFVSSIAVYSDFRRPGLAETDPVHVDDPGWYGGEKVLAEQVLADSFPGRAGIARCHAILGPRDDGTAFQYWLTRLARQEVVLAPGSGDDPVQYVDVRDVATWIVDCVEQRRAGVHNLAGPEAPLSFRSFLEGSRSAIGSRAELVWVDADFLRKESGIRSFQDMPLWAPLDEEAGFQQISSAKALRDGMTYRPLAETAEDAWRWFRSHFFRDAEFPRGGMGISQERESAILAAWRAARAAGV